MVEVKQMPFAEKLAGILSYEALLEGFASRLVKDELGKEKLNELQDIWKKESDQIPKVGTDQERYEKAYRSFVRNWVSANALMGKYQGEAGTTKFMRAAIAGWKSKHARSAFALKFVESISRKAAFHSLAKELAYQLQMFSPFIVSELSENRLALKVAPCKILEVDGKSDFCVMACQNIIPAWLEAQFNVKMSSKRDGANCTVNFAMF